MKVQSAIQKICFFNSVKFWGGGEKWHYDTALHMYEAGMEVSFVLRQDSMLDQKIGDLPFRKVSMKAKPLSFLNPLKVYRLYRYFKKEHINTVVLNSSAEMKLGGLAASLAGVPMILYARGLGMPVKASFINKICFKYFITHFLVNSEETRRNLTQNFGGELFGKEIKVIYHGIDLDQAVGARKGKYGKYRQEDNELLLVHVARLSAEKGQKHLVEVARILKEKQVPFRLLIAGTGPEEEALRKISTQNQLEDRVIFLGHINDVDELLACADVFLFSSIMEGFGFAVVEAMYAGKPVIAFNTCSMPELIHNGTTGYLIAPFDHQCFADKIRGLYENKQVRKTMGEAAKAKAIQRFNKSERLTELRHYILKAVQDEAKWPEECC